MFKLYVLGFLAAIAVGLADRQQVGDLAARAHTAISALLVSSPLGVR